jgi:hypothetical protein
MPQPDSQPASHCSAAHNRTRATHRTHRSVCLLWRCRRGLWLAIILTAVGVGAVLWLVERWANIRPPSGRHPPPGLQKQVWMALGHPMQVLCWAAAVPS